MLVPPTASAAGTASTSAELAAAIGRVRVFVSTTTTVQCVFLCKSQSNSGTGSAEPRAASEPGRSLRTADGGAAGAGVAELEQ
eukprot:scaffold1714_cov111-Isochrysis_galbana.AAC.6